MKNIDIKKLEEIIEKEKEMILKYDPELEDDMSMGYIGGMTALLEKIKSL